MNRKIFILLSAFTLSRILFINTFPVFFDSPEYLQRFSNPNYFQAIVSGHIPFHITYILIYWPIFQMFNYLHINPPFMIIIAQIIFSAFAVYCFYRFMEMISNKKIAYFTTILGVLLPLCWITNVTVMQESTCVNFFLISLFLLALYAKKKTYSNLYFITGFISFELSLLAHPLVLLWSPFLIFVIYLLKKEKTFTVFLGITICTIISILINGFFVSNSLHLSFLNGIHKYLYGENNLLPNFSSILMILRFIRDGFSPILQNNTVIIFIIAIISLVRTFKLNKKLFIFAFLWISPSIIANQWFNPLLSGRHSIIAGFGFAFLVAILLEKRKILFFITLAYILIVFLPALSLLKQPIPYLTEQEFVKTLPKGLLIETHFARPQIEGHYSGKIIFVNEPGWNKEKLKKAIDSYLSSKRPIFITSQALSEPYGLYSGPFLLPVSLSYAKTFELEDIIPSYSVKEYFTINKDAGLTIYQITSKEKSKYPNIPRLNYNKHRIDYFDPIIQLWFFIERAKIIQSHNIIKG